MSIVENKTKYKKNCSFIKRKIFKDFWTIYIDGQNGVEKLGHLLLIQIVNF